MSARLALVIGQLGWGGAERQLANLAPALAASGETVSVFCLSREEEPFGDELREAGVPVFTLMRRGNREVGRVLALGRLLRREKIELVHSFLENAGIYAWMAGPLAGRPLLLPSVRSLPAGGDRLHHALTRRTLRTARLVIANSLAASKAYAGRYGVPIEKFRVVPNGVRVPAPTSEQEHVEAKAALHLASANPVLGMMSKDDPDKNIPAFLRLTERLVREYGQICALAAGRGLDESYAARRTGHHRHSVCQALFLGPRREVDGFYRALDLFVLTSLRESQPNVLLEAMARGLPCVAYAVGGIPEIIEHGQSGLLVEPGDEEGLFQAVVSVLQSAEHARELGENAHRRVLEHFSIESMVRSTRNVYRELLNV